MWVLLNSDDEIIQTWNRPAPAKINGVIHKASIFNLWDASQLAAVDIWSVTMTNAPKDDNWNFTSSPVLAVTKDGDTVTGVTGTYTSTLKPFKDVYVIKVASTDGFSVGDKVAASGTYSSAAKQGNIISKDFTGENVEIGLNVEITKGTWAKGNTVKGFNSSGNALSPAVSTTISADLKLLSRGKQWDVTQSVKGTQKSKLKQYDWYYIRKADNATAVPSAVQTYRDGVRTEAARLETAIAATTTIAELRAVDLNDGWPEELS
tara:strand:- start:16 stop:804 length:789 start_codon:yes stop_codon:yes gene_type:complete